MLFTLLLSVPALRCDGSEAVLSQCDGRTGRQAQSCGHGADAGLVCNKPERKDTCNEAKVSTYG